MRYHIPSRLFPSFSNRILEVHVDDADLHGSLPPLLLVSLLLVSLLLVVQPGQLREAEPEGLRQDEEGGRGGRGADGRVEDAEGGQAHGGHQGGVELQGQEGRQVPEGQEDALWKSSNERFENG